MAAMQSCLKSKTRNHRNSNRKTFRQSVLEVTVDQPTTCRDGTFYVDGVEVENCVDCVNSKTDEGHKWQAH